MGSMGQESLFVSYSHEDRALVMALLRLQADLWSAAFIDYLHTPRGAAWWEAHEIRIRGADRVLLCWSAHSAKSKQVEREWRYALSQRKSLIPVCLDTTPLPSELARLHAVSLAAFLRTERTSEFFLEQAELFAKHGHAIGVGVAAAAAAALSVLVYAWLTTAMPPLTLMLLTVPVILAALGSMRLLMFSSAWSRLRDVVHAEVILGLKGEVRRREAEAANGDEATPAERAKSEIDNDEVHQLRQAPSRFVANDFDSDLALLGQRLAKSAAQRRVRVQARRLKAEADARGVMEAPLYDDGRVKCPHCKTKVVLQSDGWARVNRCPKCATKLIALPVRRFPAHEQFGHAFIDGICARCGCSIQFVTAFKPPCPPVAPSTATESPTVV
jgi:hypothetical protein